MDRDEKPQLCGVIDNALVTDIVDIGILIGRMELDSFQAHLLYNMQFLFVVRGSRMDASKRNDGKSLFIRFLMSDGMGKLVDMAELRGLGYNGKYDGMSDSRFFHGETELLQGAVCIGDHSACKFQIVDSSVGNIVGKYMSMKINDHKKEPPYAYRLKCLCSVSGSYIIRGSLSFFKQRF